MSTAMAATFNYKVVRQFSIMTVVWGIVGMLVGVIIAAELHLAGPHCTAFRGSRTAGCARCTPTR